MSYEIENLKFTIFGHGYDATRNDSGTGEIEPTIHDMTAEYCAIDETGTYAWIVGGGRLSKIKISDWSSEPHSLPVAPLYHPCNVANNYGVLFSDSRIVIFDLTSGEILHDISGTFSSRVGTVDCILVDDVIYIVKTSVARANATVVQISLENESVSYSASISGVSCCGFSSDSLVYGYWAKEWFSQVSSIYSWTLNGAMEWSYTEPSTSEVFTAKVHGLCGNGYLYLPTPEEGKWKLGEYLADIAPNLIAPLPSRTFGEFATSPEFTANYCYNNGKTKAVFQTNHSGTYKTYLTDFTDFRELDESISDLVPLAMNNRLVISRFNGFRQVAVHYF